jgi:hypothetical protein
LKYWLYNRFNYVDSKYLASDYKTDYVTMRLYTPSSWVGVKPNGDFEFTPFTDQYLSVKYDSYLSSVRAKANEKTTVSAPDIVFNDTVTTIYGAGRLSSLGDLSAKYAGTVDISNATQLTELIVGSSVSGYSNTNLKSVSVGNNKLLRKIDVRNCPNLTQALDVSQCDAIEEIYAKGTSVQSILLPEGEELKVLNIPKSITNLKLINKPKLTSIDTEGYDSLNVLQMQNSSINPFDIIMNASNLEFIRLIEVDCETTINYVRYIMNLKGIDENNMECKVSDVVSGVIVLEEGDDEVVAELSAFFPKVKFSYKKSSKRYAVIFKDGDGNVLETKTVLQGDDAVYTGATPTKTSTAQYHYTFTGWDRTLTNITSNITATAQFKSELRYYTINFINSDTLEVISSQSVAYGSMPTKPDLPDGFNKWRPAVTSVVSDANYMAVFSSDIMTAVIDLSNSNPATCVSYADDALEMTAKSSEWDDWFGHYPCLFKNGGEVGRLNKDNFSFYESGAYADIVSGDAGDVMIAFPRRGLKIETVDNKVYISMTNGANEEGFEYNAHTRGTTNKEMFYLGAYKGYTLDSKLRSLSGQSPTVSQTIGTFRTQAQANGTGYEQFAFYQLTYIQCMFILKYKSLNSQTALGQGYVGGSAKQNTGATDSNGMDYGSTSTTSRVKLFGLEDFWGNVRDWIDGLYCNSSYNILTGNDGFNNTGSGYTNNGNGGLTSSRSGYMKVPMGSTKTGFIPKTTGGSSTTYFSDFAFCNSSYLPAFGGYWGNGSNAGAFSLSVRYSASVSDSDFGARLMFL